VIIDEVQYAPGLFRHLKTRIDQKRDAAGQMILTGSQPFSLMEGVSESLAGRLGLLELEGLSFSELHAALPSVSPLELAQRGALPELWKEPELEPREYYHAYVATYLERDVRGVLNVSSLRDFERFLRACALRSAQILNKAELARDVGISPSTASQWLSVLQASDQVYLLEPWFSNRTKSLVKSPKLYLSDSGLLCFLLSISTLDELLDSPHAGAVWETLVCGELRRQIRFGARSGQLLYWRDRNKEVDFLVHRGGRFELYEAKWTEQAGASDARFLKLVAAELPKRSVTRQGVVCRASNRYPIADDVQALPLAEL
jgi:predicted AAA+ superfamily ATPase